MVDFGRLHGGWIPRSRTGEIPMRYRRAWTPGGCFFFTAVTFRRRPLLLRPFYLDRLRSGFQQVRHTRPFTIDAIVILPDHLHSVWRLPEGDADLATRWWLIRQFLSRGLSGDFGYAAASPIPNRERSIWQRDYCEYRIRDEQDWRRHVDYIHFNPVRHGYVRDRTSGNSALSGARSNRVGTTSVGERKSRHI